MTNIVGTQEYARIDSLLKSIGTLAKSEATDLLLGSVRDDLSRIRRYHENAQDDADARRKTTPLAVRLHADIHVSRGALIMLRNDGAAMINGQEIGALEP